MNKTTYLLFILFCCHITVAQQLAKNEKGQIFYDEVVEVEALDSEKLFLNIREWFGKSFLESESELLLNDKEESKLIGKGGVVARMKTLGKLYDAGRIQFTIELQSKHGRYRYQISDFYFVGSLDLKYVTVPLETEDPPGYLIRKQWESVKEFAAIDIELLISQMKASISVVDKNDW